MGRFIFKDSISTFIPGSVEKPLNRSFLLSQREICFPSQYILLVYVGEINKIWKIQLFKSISGSFIVSKKLGLLGDGF